MNIGIIAPSPVPFCIGGAETLSWGLLTYLNQATNHCAELIKVPGRESTFDELISSYRAFASLDVSHFDVVISSKYPAWMVRHPRHICYLLHRLRGLYDTYNAFGKPITYSPTDADLIEVQDFMRAHAGERHAVEPLFDRLDRLRSRNDLAAETFEFPGPLSREIIHFLDGVGLSPRAIEGFAAISGTVASRAGYFPDNVGVEVIYPPSHLDGLGPGHGEYLFTISRLDGPKRVSLLIEAMRHVRSDVELVIGGTGPDAERLRRLAAEDPRIRFIGFVKDRDVVDLYSHSIAVPYVPLDEDYGLVTIEAMRSGKPVITTTDSGGPNEFVLDGVTGFSVPPRPELLAEKIDLLCENRQIADDMGSIARRRVDEITWENAVGRLLRLAGDNTGRVKSTSGRTTKRLKLSVAAGFPIYPPRAGGQVRAFSLYRQLAKTFDIDLITMTNHDEPGFDGEIAPGLREIRIPRSREHYDAEVALSSQVSNGLKDWIPITDVATPRLYRKTPAYLEALHESVHSSALAVACHPYLLPAIRDVTQLPLWYESHNAELDLKKQMLPSNPTSQELLYETWVAEKNSCDKACLVTVCSLDDQSKLCNYYSVDPVKLIEVPNGVDPESTAYRDPQARRRLKQQLGIDGRFVALFMGSWHEPNLEAVSSIVAYAGDLPEIAFLIVGSVGRAFAGECLPANVGLVGEVDDLTKGAALAVADLALNPISSGSGTNLKLLDYCAAGIRVISTAKGIRGLGSDIEKLVDVVSLEDFPNAVRAASRDGTSVEERVASAREYVSKNYAWSVLTEPLSGKLLKICQGNA